MATKDRKQGRESITLVIDRRVAWVGAALVVGFVGWSLVRFGMSLGAPHRHAHARCQFELDSGDDYLLAEGFVRDQDCKTDLLSCHGEPAHKVKGMVKEMLADGKHPDEIRASLDDWAPLAVSIAEPPPAEATAAPADGSEADPAAPEETPKQQSAGDVEPAPSPVSKTKEVRS